MVYSSILVYFEILVTNVYQIYRYLYSQIKILTIIFKNYKMETVIQTWTLDKSHAKLGFSATHMLVSDVEGFFKNFDIKVNTTKEDFSDASIELMADKIALKRKTNIGMPT